VDPSHEQPRQRPRHVLFGWRLLTAPLVVQVLADNPSTPRMGAAEGARRYDLCQTPPHYPAQFRREI
jgi:hypothetical protein